MNSNEVASFLKEISMLIHDEVVKEFIIEISNELTIGYDTKVALDIVQKRRELMILFFERHQIQEELISNIHHECDQIEFLTDSLIKIEEKISILIPKYPLSYDKVLYEFESKYKDKMIAADRECTLSHE